MVEYKSLRENSTSILEREKNPCLVYKNMKGFILEANLDKGDKQHCLPIC